MRIALVSTCAVAVPPAAYGGTELVVAELAKGLVALGHDVTVHATGDSRPAGRLCHRFSHPVWPPNDLAELQHAAHAWRDLTIDRPDVVHVHQTQAIAFTAVLDVPTALTIHHVREELPVEFYLDFPDVAYVAISRRQAELFPELDVARVIHHGLDPIAYPAGDGDGGYCAFLGRFAAEKGVHTAIDAARLAGLPIELGGAPHWKDEVYFAREIAPRIARGGRAVVTHGELGHARKVALLRGARALLSPIEWEEPFGLVMIEAMLVGTPVIAFPRGSVREIVDEGVTGYVVEDRDAMAKRLRALEGFDRARCRAHALERWSNLRMARDHEQLYASMCERRRRPTRHARPVRWH